MTRKEQFNADFIKAKKEGKDTLLLYMSLPDGVTEAIINFNAATKVKYINKVYNESLTMNANSEIFIYHYLFGNSADVINQITMMNEGENESVSDGHHTFEELYHHRMILFSIICNSNKGKSWKSKLHHDGTMFDDYFIVGIETEKGQYSYHYKMEYYDMFKVKELEYAPEYDGHQPSDIIRLLSLVEEN